jgi:hypothetical protein
MTASITQSTKSQISPMMERMYHQSNLLGDWKGLWSKTHQTVELKILNIRGTKAQVEYTANGQTQKGFADVSGGLVTFGNVSIATRDGQTAVMEFSSNYATQTAVLAKVASTTAQSQLVGSWSGYANGQGVSFTVNSVDGKSADVRVTANGSEQSGTATVYQNTVMLSGVAQITSNDGQSGTAVVQVRGKSYAVPITKLKSASSSSSTSSSAVNKLA